MSGPLDPSFGRPVEGLFPNTSWTLIRQSQEVADPEALRALDQLARSYWKALYAFVRSMGYDQHWAEDAVQRFFEQLVSRDSLRSVIPGETRFRSFLIACLKRSMASEHRLQMRQKRGGGVELESLTEEHGTGLEEVAGRSPEEAMDRAWAQEVFDKAFAHLERDAVQRGRAEVFAVLRPILRGEPPPGGYAAVAVALSATEAAARKMVFDLRARLGVIIRREVAATVAHPGEVEDELRYLLSLL